MGERAAGGAGTAVMRRGDIFVVGLDPTAGREIQKQRPVLIVSPTAFNRQNPPLAAPITRGGAAARLGLMAVPLTGAGAKTDGVVLCNQLRTLDLAARGGKFVERLPDAIVEAVIDRIADIYEFCAD